MLNKFNFPGKPTSFLKPGEVFVTGDNMVISTVLGSCVAVCLWNEDRRTGGMNHVMLPVCRETDPVSTRFGNIATFVLYDLMKKNGGRGVHARVFGGACRLSSEGHCISIGVGKRNVEITLAVLDKLGIPVVGKDVRGNKGRKILFDVHTGKIRMNYIENFQFDKEIDVSKLTTRR